jgi:uncharacterized protein YcfJ
MRRFVVALGALSSALSLAAAPAGAATHRTHHTRTAYNSRAAADCERARHRSGNTGTVLGAIGGGVIGSQMAEPGSRTLGTVLGAGGGAVVGHQIAKSSHRCR